MELLSRILECEEIAPQKIALRSNGGENTLTYGELSDLTGRVYSYLKQQGIGKEDFVMLHLPRGIEIIAAMFGVWRAGAACVVCEDIMPAERVEYVYHDCQCKLSITQEIMDAARQCEPLQGYAEIDPHDMAFAVYTSGSTGTPKGVIHEFGKLDIILQIDAKADYDHNNQVVGCIAPLNTILTVLLLAPALANHGILDIVPYSVIKNPRELLRYIAQYGIRMMFFPPSFLKMLPMLPPQLQTIFVGSEKAEGVYREGVRIFNGYSLSECGFTALYHIVQEGEQNSPVGKSLIGLNAFLVDDDRKPIQSPGMGELVIESPYTRGYIMKEKNCDVFDGDLLYTGDIARIDENGVVTLVGRKDDMIKIHGNRIDPSEIELAVKQVLGIPWAVAKGFQDSHGSYICVYYKDQVAFEPDVLRQELSKKLPEYMIPAAYMYLPQPPMLPNGKIDKKMFPKPDMKKRRVPYQPPRTDLEKTLCEAFQKILNVDQIGIHDDFYQLGGDSLSSMELLSIIPFDIPTEVLFEMRTPGRIAVWCQENANPKDRDWLKKENEKAKRRAHPLTAMQRYVLNYQMYTPFSTMWNLPVLIRFDIEQIPPETMKSYVQKMLDAHPALQTVLSMDRKGILQQQWSPERMEGIGIEHISEKEFAVRKQDLVRPFSMLNEPLYRCRIFRTEKAGYVFWDFHHIITDGTSFQNLRRDFIRLLDGGEIPEDYYYLNVMEDRDNVESELYYHAKQSFAETYGGDDWTFHPAVDFESTENKKGHIEINLPISGELLAKVRAQYGVSNNVLYMAALLLSVGEYNRCRNIQNAWVYHGRGSSMRKDTVGLLFRLMPVAIRLTDGMTMQQVFESVKQQVNDGMMYNCYPFALDMFQCIVQDRVTSIYQTGIYDFDVMAERGMELLELSSKYDASCGVLDTYFTEYGDEMQIEIEYAASRYKPESLQRFANILVDNINQIVTNQITTIEMEKFGL